jgi:hypothetical protein
MIDSRTEFLNFHVGNSSKIINFMFDQNLLIIRQMHLHKSTTSDLDSPREVAVDGDEVRGKFQPDTGVSVETRDDLRLICGVVGGR